MLGTHGTQLVQRLLLRTACSGSDHIYASGEEDTVKLTLGKGWRRRRQLRRQP